MLGIVVSRADSASVHIGEHLLELADWDRHEDDSRPDAAGGGTVYRTDGVCLREFEALHLDLERPAAAFADPTLLAFASRHSGETGRLLTAHHTGNAGPAEFGGEANRFARACPNAHATVLDALATHAPDGYEVGMECTHHGPSEVGAPSMFVEVGSAEPQWSDPAAARAVAKALLDLRGVAPDRPVGTETDRRDDSGTDQQADRGDDSESGADWTRRQFVGLGGGHYTPRFERVVRETDWAVGHVVADWGFDALDGARETRRAVLDRAFTASRAAYALVDGDRPGVEETVADLGYRPVSETWLRETDGVDLGFVRDVERSVTTVADGLRFGERAPADRSTVEEHTVTDLPGELLDEAFGIDRERTRAAVAGTALALVTGEGGTRPTGRVVLADADDRERIVDELVDVLGARYDSLDRESGLLVAREAAFDPDLARTLGVPEGPAFGRLSAGEPVEVDGETIPPSAVTRERERRFPLSR